MAMRLGRFICMVTFRGFGYALGLALAMGSGTLLIPEARGQADSGGSSLDQLLRMSPAELEQLYRQGAVVAIPEGPIRGTALLSPGTRRTRTLSRGARLFWQGKVFEPGGTTAVNRFFGVRIVRAQVVQGPSWLDGGPALVLDYSQTSRVYADNRDEIRQVAPGLFLGLMYDRTTSPPGLKLYFALQTQP
jgi:hypothetical protein